jgi:hypothetical protein
MQTTSPRPRHAATRPGNSRLDRVLARKQRAAQRQRAERARRREDMREIAGGRHF